MRIRPMIVHTLLLLAGMTCLYLAYQQFLKTRQLLLNGVITTATVVENLVEAGDGSDMYRPKFQYMNRQHQPVEFTGTVSSNPPAWTVGETAMMIYNPGSPRSERLISYWNLYRGTIIWAALAAPFLVIGIGYFLFNFYSRDLVRHF